MKCLKNSYTHHTHDQNKSQASFRVRPCEVPSRFSGLFLSGRQKCSPCSLADTGDKAPLHNRFIATRVEGSSKRMER